MKIIKSAVLGRREFVDLPDLNACGIEAKIDTGAFRTALHCLRCNEVIRDGIHQLEAVFDFDGKGERVFYFPKYKLRTIKNSFGQSEERYCVRARLRIGDVIISSDLSLTDRSNMKYQVLIGRKTLGRKFLIDVSSIHMGNRKKRKK